MHNPDDAATAAEAILGLVIKGLTVKRVMVAQGARIAQEFYFSILLDRANRTYLAMCSKEGGMDIETLAVERPEALAKVAVDPNVGIDEAKAARYPFEEEPGNGYWPEIRRHWAVLLFLALTGTAVFGVLQYVGLIYTTAVNMGVLNSFAPVMIAVAGAVLFGDRLTPVQAIGVVVSLSGVLLIVLIFLAVAEMGLSRMSKPRASSLADKGLKSGKALKKLVDQPERGGPGSSYSRVGHGLVGGGGAPAEHPRRHDSGGHPPRQHRYAGVTVSDSLQRSHTYSDARRAVRVPQNLFDSRLGAQLTPTKRSK